jgi:hypothetical protein
MAFRVTEDTVYVIVSSEHAFIFSALRKSLGEKHVAEKEGSHFDCHRAFMAKFL